MTHNKQWINPKEFEEMFDIKISTQKKLRADKKLPYVKYGKFVKYDIDDINQLFENHKVMAS